MRFYFRYFIIWILGFIWWKLENRVKRGDFDMVLEEDLDMDL
jgi:hypothetical protein